MIIQESTRRQLSFDEIVALFKLVDREDDARPNAGIDAVSEVSPDKPAPERKTVSRTMGVAKHLRRRSLERLPMASNHEDRQSIAQDVGYSATPALVERVAMMYLRWRQEKLAHSRWVDSRTRRLLNQMWIPTFRQLPLDLLSLGPGFHGRDIQGRWLRWTQGDRREVERVWLSPEDEMWFLGSAIEDIDELNTIEVQDKYLTLQIDTAEFLTMAVAQATAERTQDANFSVAEIEDARWGQGLGSQAQDEAVKSIIRILDDPSRLQDRLLVISDSIFAAMELRETST